MKVKKCLLLIFSVTLLLNVVQKKVLEADQGTFEPTDDAYIEYNYLYNTENKNYGNLNNLQVGKYGGTYHFKLATLLKFDLRGLPSYTYVSVAKLYLYFYGGYEIDYKDTFQLKLARYNDDNWDEDTITWNSAKEPDHNVGELGTKELSLSANHDQWIELSVSPINEELLIDLAHPDFYNIWHGKEEQARL